MKNRHESPKTLTHSFSTFHDGRIFLNFIDPKEDLDNQLAFSVQLPTKSDQLTPDYEQNFKDVITAGHRQEGFSADQSRELADMLWMIVTDQNRKLADMLLVIATAYRNLISHKS